MDGTEPDRLDPEAIRRRVSRRYKDRIAFLFHLAGYICGSLFFWGIWLFLRVGILKSNNPESDFQLWPLVIMLIWGIVLVGHGLAVLVAPSIREAQERAVQREIEQEASRLSAVRTEKPKRGSISLGDDGELDYTEDEPEQVKKSERMR